MRRRTESQRDTSSSDVAGRVSYASAALISGAGGAAPEGATLEGELAASKLTLAANDCRTPLLPHQTCEGCDLLKFIIPYI